jgi:nicotinamide mononucleotide transporter
VLLEKYILFLEILGASTGIAGVWLTAKEHPSCFPLGLISVATTFLLLNEQGFYANALLQIVFAALLIAGWYQWIRKREYGKLVVSELKKSNSVAIFIITLGAGILTARYFATLQGSQSPYLDGITACLSITAQWLVAKKKIENWILWIVANTIYIGMYLTSAMYIYAALYAVYLFLAINGWQSWSVKLKQNRL